MPSETLPTMLIVRPALQTAADIAVCQAAGWQAAPFSPIALETDAAALAGLNDKMQAADVVFWVSPSAVALAAPHVAFSDGQIHITVGKGSRAVLADFFRHEIFCPAAGNDSEAVLRLPVWQTLAAGAKILIIRGHGGRDFLAQKLAESGFTVETAEVYFRRPQALDWALFERLQPKAAYITSSEIVHALFAQVPPRLTQPLQSLLYLTHHARIAEALRAAGATRIKQVAGLDVQTLNHALNGVTNE